MRKAIFLLIGIAFISCIKGNEYSFIKEFKVTAPVNLKISTSGGNITTTAFDKNDVVEVTFIVKKRGQILKVSLDDLQKFADVEITNENNNLEINVTKMLENTISIGFEIKTPKQSACSLKTSGGNIKLSGVNGNQEVRTSGGNLALDSITGNIDGRTSGGNISITNIKADIIAKTSGGNISLDNIEGKVEANTSGGGIKISNSRFDVIASTSGGSIKLNDAQGKIDLNTSGGSITLNNISGSIEAKTSGESISADIAKLEEKLVLKTSGGSIDANIPSGLGMDLNLSADKVKTQLKGFSGSAERGKIVGQMNGGGIQVVMSTSGGDVTLNYK
jgi:hypothetical protein